jgi:ABC-type sugar transport system ATPase subunit
MNDVLRLDRIRKSHGRRVLFQGVTLGMAAGEAVALVGSSGIGKTTLLRIAAGLDVPDSGEVWIGGQCARLEEERYSSHRTNEGLASCFRTSRCGRT